jgi:phage terminase large subunit-like protein
VAFYQQHADIACNFFEKILKHTADEWYGRPFILCPWQEEALTQIFGNLDADGNRIIEQVYLEVPKKTGKTEFVAGVLLLVTTLTKAPGFQAYGAAAATRQAMNVYRACCKMVEQAPILARELRIMRGTNRIVKRRDPDSFYAAVAADGDFGDGVNPAFTVADEVHRWKTRKQMENWDVLSKGGITRAQTLTIGITTAGVQEDSPLAWKLHEKTQRIKDGIVHDPRFLGRIYAAEKSDDPALPSTWIKANPSLKENGGFLDKEKIRKEYESAVAEGDLTSFKRYFLNIWDQKEDRAIDMAQWDASAGEWKAAGLLDATPEHVIAVPDGTMRTVRPLPHDLLARFVERRCWAGVDLSMTTDTTAVVFVFPRDGEDRYDVLPFFWLPSANVRKLGIKLGVPLEQWARDGFIELSPGEVIDYRDIQARLRWGKQMFDLQEIDWDPWNSRQASVPMLEEGDPCIEIQQGFKKLNEPTKKIKELVVRAALHHGGHPVLRWHAGCACTTTDGKDNIMFDKPSRDKGTSRIDGMAAIANAMTGAMIAGSSRLMDDFIIL